MAGRRILTLVVLSSTSRNLNGVFSGVVLTTGDMVVMSMDRNTPIFAGVAILAILVVGATVVFVPTSSTASESGSSISTTSTGSTATEPEGTAILPAGTVIQVSSSYDCVAGHYSLSFSTESQALLTGGFSAGAPGATLYVATVQQASVVYQGHPSSWVYSTGLQNSSRFATSTPPGAYVVWIEGANLNCGARIVMPLERLTNVTITEAFVLKSAIPS